MPMIILILKEINDLKTNPTTAIIIATVSYRIVSYRIVSQYPS
ncbi:MAG: hypothetical protein ACI90V_010670, partial [Bacillariaceae sp.]